MEDKYKSLLVLNESTDAHITVNFYMTWDIVCWIPHKSHEIKPKGKLRYSNEKGCKLGIIARFKGQNQQKMVLLKPQQWLEDKLIRITDSLVLAEETPPC